MVFRHLVVLIGVLTTCLSGQTAGGLTGRVVDPQGLAVSEAYVELRAAGKRLASTNTDATGAFRLAPSGGGPFTLHVVRAGFEPKDTTDIEPGKELTVTLAPGGSESMVSAVVSRSRLTLTSVINGSPSAMR